MEQSKPLFSFNVAGINIDIMGAIVIQWVIILILGITAYMLTKDLKEKPDSKQAFLEKIYITVSDQVSNIMGEEFADYIPYIGTLMIFLICMNFTGLIGIEPPTKEVSVTIGLALTSFFMIHYTSVKRNGAGSYLKTYLHPVFVMLPINIMEKAVFPVSLALRLYGNMLAASMLINLVYNALGKFAVGLPIFVHGYFDLFDGTIQMLVFSVLTMIQIKMMADE